MCCHLNRKQRFQGRVRRGQKAGHLTLGLNSSNQELVEERRQSKIPSHPRECRIRYPASGSLRRIPGDFARGKNWLNNILNLINLITYYRVR
jgi:hypothetical protein